MTMMTMMTIRTIRIVDTPRKHQRNTKEIILVALKKQPEISVRELSDQLTAFDTTYECSRMPGSFAIRGQQRRGDGR